MTDRIADRVPQMSPLWLLMGRFAAFLPSYGLCVDREARRLISACGANAATYAAQEAEDALSLAWARSMKQVEHRILTRQARH